MALVSTGRLLPRFSPAPVETGWTTTRHDAAGGPHHASRTETPDPRGGRRLYSKGIQGSGGGPHQSQDSGLAPPATGRTEVPRVKVG